MTTKDIHEVLDRAVGETDRIDLTEAAWAQGRAMRRRRRGAYAAGATALAAAGIVGVLTLSGVLGSIPDPAPAIPTPLPSPTQEEPPVPDAGDAQSFVFQREGAQPVPDLRHVGDGDVPDAGELTGSTWQLLGSTESSLVGEPAGGGITFINDEDVIGVDVPTDLSFLDTPQGTLLSMSMGACGGATFQDDLLIGPDGRFAGQNPATDDVGCSTDVQQSEDFWMEALAGGGWVHLATPDTLLLSVSVPDPPEASGESPLDEPTAIPTGTVSMGEGHGLTVPAGWTYLPLYGGYAQSSCVLPEGETALHFPWCLTGIEIRVGAQDARVENSDWWDPTDPGDGPPEECYADPQGYDGWSWRDNAVTFEPDPLMGQATVGDHPVEWLRWKATCADSQAFTAESWRILDLGIEVLSRDSGDHDLEAVVQSLVLDQEVPAITEHTVEVSEPIGESVVGELQEWAPGHYQGTGEQVSFPITAASWCLATQPDRWLGRDLERTDCTNLAANTAEVPIVVVITDADGMVLTVHVLDGS